MLFFSITQAKAQIGAMKLVGKDTKNYDLGFGAFIKSGIPVNEGSDLTIEGGVDIFFLNDAYGTADGTLMCLLEISPLLVLAAVRHTPDRKWGITILNSVA